MSEFDQRMAIADDGLFQEHETSQTVTLRPDPTAAAIPLQHVIVSDETVMERETEATNQLVIKRIITFSTDDQSPRYSGVDDPKRIGTFTVNDVEYQVADIARDSFGVAIMEGRRYGLIAVHRRGHEGGVY
jgi:hypothetical protein